MKPSLIIGIGGSGMAIGHSLKYLFHSYMPEELESNVKFLFFENDKNEFNTRILQYVRGNKSLINQNEIIKLTDFNAFKIAQELIKYEKGESKLKKEYEELYDWIDLTKNYPPGTFEEGLAANRMIGRLCGYVNYNNILPAIQSAASEITQILKGGKAAVDNLNIYIISSHCGGTGSSLFFDISALIDHSFNSSTMIPKTFFMINSNYFLEHKRGDGYLDDTPEFKNIQINSWACIDECEYFLNKFSENPSEMGKFVAKPSLFESRVSKREVIIPFSSGIIFDQIASNKKQIPKDKFYESLSNIIFYSLTSTSDDEFRSYIGVNKFKEKEGHKGEFEVSAEEQYKYGSIGIKTIRFPKEELTEYFNKRYLYEIFTNKFLDENPKEALIEKRSKEFVNDVFANLNSPTNSFIIATEGTFQNNLDAHQFTSQIEFKKKYVEGRNKLFCEPDSDKINEESSVIAEFERHKREIEEFKVKVEEIFNKLKSTNMIGFYENFKDRSNVADHIRRILWKRVYEVIKETGYYGVVGRYSNNIKIKGFLQEVRERLIELYQEFTNNYINSDTSKIMHDLENIRIQILQKSKGKIIGRAKVNSISNELNNYVKKLQELRDAIVQKYKLKMMQQILFEFAVGDAERSLLVNSAFPERIIGKTDLGKYEDEINIRIGLTSLNIEEQPVNLIRMFDDGNEKSETIKNMFTKLLRNNFRDSEKDLFTTFLPFELTTLLDENDRVDGWKKRSIVDKLFRDNVKIDIDEIDRIFKPTENQPDIEIISLLTRFEDIEKRSTLKEVLNSIVQKINEYCQSTYTKNTENEIGSFLNWNIKDAFANSSDKMKEGLLSNINEVTFPVHTENIGGLRKVGPYVNVNPSLESFVNSVLKLKSDKIVKCPNLEESKIVLVRYVGGIDYKEIYGNELNQYVYLHRNIDLFKPFLNKNWNKKVKGPWGDTEEYILNANINSFDYKLEYLEALALLIGMDLLFQKNKTLADKIFVNDPKLTKNKTVINRSPIHYITQLKQFVYYPDVKINDQVVPGVDKLWIEDSGIKSNKKLLPLSQDLTKKLLSFRGTIKELRSDEQFASMLSSFISVISFHFQEIESILKKEIENIETPFPQIYTTIKRRGQKEISNYHHEDLETAQKFDDIVKSVLSRLFGL